MINKNLKLKSISLILIFTLIFQYIGVIIPLLSSIALTIEDNNGIMWEYYISDNKAINVRLSNKNVTGAIEVPETLDGYEVSIIGSNAFEGASGITSIMIPSCVENIGNNCFKDCTNLKIVNIQSSTIDNLDNQFSNLENLEKIIVSDNNLKYSTDNKGVLFNKDKTTLIICPMGFKWTNYTIPSTVIYLTRYSFSNCKNLEKVTFSENMNSINNFVFFRCENLKEIIIPNNIKTIGSQAFNSCNNLQIVNIREGVQTIEAGAFVKDIFSAISETNVFVYSDNINILYNNFKSNCTMWVNKDSNGERYAENNDIDYYYLDREQFTDENDIKWEYNVRNGEFAEYLKIKSEITSQNYNLIIPDKVNNYKVRIIDSGSPQEDGNSAILSNGKLNVKSVVIPDGVTKIGKGAFRNFSNMETITIPSSVTAIGENAFEGCNNLKIICDVDSIAYNYAINNNIDVMGTVELTFNDQNLFDKIKEYASNNHYDILNEDSLNKTLKLKLEDINKIKQLDISNSNITDLTGISGLRDLEELNASGNNLEVILKEKISTSKLIKLDLSNNNIKNLKADFSDLKELNLSNNEINSLENIDFENFNKLEILNLSNNNLDGFYEFCTNSNKISTLKSLKQINLDNNKIADITFLNNMQDSEEYSLKNVSLKNQNIQIYTFEKENKISLYIPLLADAKSSRYSNDENVTFNTVDCEIVDNSIVASGLLNSNNRFAEITIHGGKMDGTKCYIVPENTVLINKDIDGDRLVLQTPEIDTNNTKPYFRYSLNGSEFKDYEDCIYLNEGINNVKVKLFDNDIETFDTNEIKIDFHAIRKNGKVFVYSNSYADKYYSFDENGNFQKYVRPIDNNSASKIYVKIGENVSREVIIENTEISSEKEYNIYDVKTGKNELDVLTQFVFYKENGKLYFVVPENWSSIQFSIDKENWRDAVKNEVCEIGNDDIKVVYLKYFDIERHADCILEKNIDNKNPLEEVLGIYNQDDKNYIFSQVRKYSSNDVRLELLNDENKIQHTDLSVKDITEYYGNKIILKDDGTVYSVSAEQNYNLDPIQGGTNIKSISGLYALDNNNTILKLDVSENPIRYKTFEHFSLTKTAQKLIVGKKSEDNIENFEFDDCSSDFLVLYEDGTLSSFHLEKRDLNQIYSWNNVLSNQAIDASIHDYRIMILEYDRVRIYSTSGIIDLDTKNLYQDDEIPIKLNDQGDILTQNGNLYSLIYRTETKTNIYGYDYDVQIPDHYSSTNKISNVRKLGNNTYQDKNGNIYYLYHDNNSVEVIQANKQVTGVNVSKDESKIDQNIVKISIEFEKNKYNVKLPDGRQASEATEYVVDKNGEYVFEFTDSEGYKFIRVVHVRNIQDRKEVKVPEVIALNKTIELRSDKPIEYSIDEKNNWNDYVNIINYTNPIYARIKSDEYECNILKITLNEQGKLEVQNEDSREIQTGILTNAIGRTNYQIYNDKTKVIKITQDVAQTISNIQPQKNIFEYVSNLVDNIIYSFSATDGRYAGCYFDDNITEMTYKDIDNNIVNITDQTVINNVKNSNTIIDYSVIKDNYVSLDKNKYEALTDKSDENINSILGELPSDYNNRITVKKNAKSYAYIDNKGNLVSNINIINMAKEHIGSNVKFVKIVGDGDTFYILTEEGEVYYLTEADNGNYVYVGDKFRLGYGLEGYNNIDVIYKLGVKNIADIYDTLTAKTKDGDIISLINETKNDSSAVQELQKQTDKYLLSSHLGLKNGKLYDFTDVNHGTEVTKGEIFTVQNVEDSIGIYSKDTKEVKLYRREVYNYPNYPENLEENEVYINVQPAEGSLPEFVDIMEYRDSYFTRPSYTLGVNQNEVLIDSKDVDKYAKCLAVAKDGKIYAYMNGFAVETGEKLDFFGPIANYELDNSNWTNKNVSVKIIPNTLNEIKNITIKKNNNILESISDNESIYGKQIGIQTNGSYVYDIKDNKERSYSGILNITNIDKLKPYSPTIETVNDKLKITFNDDKEATEDYAKSGIKERLISYDGVNWTKVNENVNFVDVESNKIVYAKAIDNAGNESDITSGKKGERTGVVVTKYQDMDGNSLIQDKLYSGNIGENYEVQVISISGYEHKETIGSLNGTYSNNEKTVILKYQKIQKQVQENGNVIVIYQDLEGNQLRQNIIITGNVGDNYVAEKLNFEGYEFEKIEGNEKGAIKKENQFVTFIYKKKNIIENGKVTVKYIDENGNSIKDDIILTGVIGEDYKTEKAKFDIYEFVEVEGNEQGKFSKENIEVIYKYNKKSGRIIIIYQDPDGNLIKENDILTNKVGEEYKVKRQIIDGYELVEIIGNEQGTYQLVDQFVMYKYKKMENMTIPQTGQSRIGYIIIGIIIIASLFGLICIKLEDSKLNK